MDKSLSREASRLPRLRRRRSGLEPKVWVGTVLLGEMEAEAALHAPEETGGMLVGYWSETGDAVVTEVIGAGPAAVRRPSRFEPDGPWQQGQLDELYLRSGRVHTYLGDWHSHPLGGSRPSFRDRETAKKIARTKQARAPHPLTVLAIKDGAEGGWRWAALRYRRRGFETLAMQRYE